MRTCVAITGAASGLGRVVASTLLESGRRAIILDRDDEQAHLAADELIKQHSIQVPVIVADLGTIAGVATAADELIQRFQVGGLVNNAGGWLQGDQYPDAAPQDWLSAVTLNLLAPMLLTQRLWPMLSAASGAVVNIGSSGGEGEDPYGSPEYAAAKAGIRRFTASLGARQDVRVMGDRSLTQPSVVCRALKFHDETINDAVHVEFDGLNARAVSTSAEKVTDSSPCVVEVHSEPIALHYDSPQLPPVIRECGSGRQDIGDVLASRSNRTVHEHAVGHERPELVPRSTVTGIEIVLVPAHNLIPARHEPSMTAGSVRDIDG